MRRLIAAVMGLSLAVVGSQVAHALVYRLAEPDAHERAHLLAGTGHAYLRFAPLGLALVTVIVALAFLLEIGAARAGAPSRPRVWMFAAVAPAMFACQEHFERLLHGGSFPWGATAERTFLLGLALQLPFALAAYALAWLLHRTASAVARLLLAPPRAGRADGCRSWVAVPATSLLAAVCAVALGPRGPPLLSS